MGYDLQRRLQEAQDELEYQQTLSRQGEAEQRRMQTNRSMDDDWLGLDDGRPGLSWTPGGGIHYGNWEGLPVELWLRILPYLVLGLIGFGLWAWNGLKPDADAGAMPPAASSPTGGQPSAP